MFYIVGFIMTFLTYGYGKVNKILYVIFSIVFLLEYHYCPVKFHQSESWRSFSGF